MKSLADLLDSGDSNHPALVIPQGPTITYRKLQEQVEILASVLKGIGLGPGQTVSLVLANSLEFAATFLAVTRLGAVVAPLNPAYTVDEYKFYMQDAESSVVILPPEEHAAREAAASLAIPCIEASATPQGTIELCQSGSLLSPGGEPTSPEPEDVALFLHTSGTTSRPKGVPLTHDNITASLKNIVDTYQLTPQDVAMVVMPLFHIHGLNGVLFSTLASGGTAVLPSRFSASSFWSVALEHKATWYSAVPTIHQILLTRADSDNAPRGTFRFIRSCSAALAPSVISDLEARFDTPVLEAYGMTEAAHQMSSNPLPPQERRAGTVGQGTGVEIAIMDETGNRLSPEERGEVVIKGSNVMHGYRNNPEANASSFTDGWFRTGDQGFIDANGYLTLTGRIKELINRGGEKISPLEIDAILAQHPAVAEAISFGVPDAKYGEEVNAAVVLKGDASQEEIHDFCKQHLIDFKVPKTIYFVDQLPRTATGKIQRRNVAAQFK